MKRIQSLLLCIFLCSQANAAELCDLLENKEINLISSLAIQNCIDDQRLFDEGESEGEGPICTDCRTDLKRKVNLTEEELTNLKKTAYIKEMQSEFKKAMSKLLIDMVSVRKLYSTNSAFNDSAKSCSFTQIKSKLSSCGSFQKDYLKQSGFEQMIPNELAALLDNRPSESSGILARDPSLNSCSISDQSIIRLAPLVVEESLTPDLVQKISSLKNITNMDSIFGNLAAAESEMLRNHPLLMSIAKEPTKLIDFFKSLQGITSKAELTKKFRQNLYTKENGNRMDSEIARKCDISISSFADKICSESFNKGKISLGPFKNFDRFNNNEFPSSTLASSPETLTKNLTMMEFCDSSPNQPLQLRRDTEAISSFILPDLQNAKMVDFQNDVYKGTFGSLKQQICNISKGSDCTNQFQCALFEAFKKSTKEGTPEFRLANSPDPAINNVLRNMVGNVSELSPATRKVLIAEGILPQANGKFVERPDVPERKPEYLADVANGTITPNTESSASSAAPIPNSNRAQKTQNQSQLASLQPLQGGNSTAAPENVAENTAEDDSEDLRRFQEGLKERLDRAEGDAAEGNKNSKVGKAKRVPASKLESPEGIVNPSALAAIAAPAPTADTSSEQTLNAPAAAPVGGKASLGPETGRQALANKQKNSALGDMSGAKSNPFAKASAGSDPLSGDGIVNSAESTVALTLSGDIQTSLKQILESKDTQGANLRSLIEKGRPFKFELNNSVFNVQFENETVNVVFRSGDPSVGPKLAATLQSVFNTTVKRSSDQTAISQRNAKLGDLKNAVGN